MKTDPKQKVITVDYLARVEGEGSLYLKVDEDDIIDAQLKIFEPPRFFEGLLRGRSFTEPPDITSRICGICPVAYQMSSLQAIEKICKVEIGAGIRELRRLLYCGEWIESHALHVFMLHIPDFLGYPDVITMAKDHREIVEKALQLKKAGNDIVNILGGREIHPINVKLGGFYRVPTRSEFNELYERLKQAKQVALETVELTSKLDFPDFDFDYEFLALRHANEYPMNEGRLVSNKGLDITVEEYDDHFREEHVSYSTTKHTIYDKDKLFFTGPMARYSLNFDLLTKDAQQAALSAGLEKECRNPFKSIIVRSVELVYACDEALRILNNYPTEGIETPEVKPQAGTGYGITEAPRGILFHRYSIDKDGVIKDANIVAPTSHNQRIIEDDLKRLVRQYIKLDEPELTYKCEQAIRNYDPCISCSTHFLKLKVDKV